MTAFARSPTSWLALLALALGGCDGKPPEPPLVGTVERTLVEVVSSVSEQILAIDVVRGERVEPGQVLVRIDPTFAIADEAQVEAELAAARTGDVVAREDHARIASLCETGVVADQQCERSTLERDEAAARLRAAEARLVAASKRRSDHVITAPVAGVVDQLPFDVGERVPVGGVVTVLMDTDPPWVRVWIPETQIANVHVGEPAEIRIDGWKAPLHGHVLDVAREPEFTPHYALTERERVHLVYEARIRIDDAPDKLRPGLPADVVLRRSAPAPEPPPQKPASSQ